MINLIFVAVFVAVCGQSAVNVQADVIECDFKGTIRYICFIKSIQQDENQNVITGNHKTGKNDSDVNAVHNWWTGSVNLTNFDSIFCQKFPNLDEMYFDKLKPVNLVENALHDCQLLDYFKLENADIKQIPENFFANNLKLLFLSLGHNRLEILPENIFSTLEKLQRLHLEENQLNYLPENVFKSLKRLRELWLENNNLTTLNPAWFDNLRILEELRLNGNKIEELPRNIFVVLEKLKELKLENNNLVTIHADSFGKKPQLTHVYLSGNKITSIDEKFIDNTAVTDLYFEDNICSQEETIKSRDEMKEKLQECFENYQPRPAEAQN